MWRYECKRHLLYLLCGAVVGMILYFMWDESFFQQINQSLMETGYHLSDTDVEMAYHFRWLLGAVMIASVVNGVLILRYAMIKFNLSGVFLLVLFLFGSLLWVVVILFVGMILLLPSFIVCIYGMVTIRNAAAKNFRTLPKGDGSEVERVYRLHFACRSHRVHGSRRGVHRVRSSLRHAQHADGDRGFRLFVARAFARDLRVHQGAFG